MFHVFANLFVASAFMFMANVSHAEQEEVVAEGHVNCSITAPLSTGFNLIRTRDLDREYTGQHDIQNMRFTGSYNPKSGRFKVSVSGMDKDWVTTESWFDAAMELPLRSHVHFTFLTLESGEPRKMDMYCRAGMSSI